MITRVTPTDFASAATVEVESDARDNISAIHEIEEWAAGTGFQRTSEYALRQALVDGARRFRGVCFRMQEDERQAVLASQAQFLQRSQHIADVLHQGGDGVGR